METAHSPQPNEYFAAGGSLIIPKQSPGPKVPGTGRRRGGAVRGDDHGYNVTTLTYLVT